MLRPTFAEVSPKVQALAQDASDLRGLYQGAVNSTRGSTSILEENFKLYFNS